MVQEFYHRELISKSNQNPYRQYYWCIHAAKRKVHPFSFRYLGVHAAQRKVQSRLQVGLWSFHWWDSTVGVPSSDARRRNSSSQSKKKRVTVPKYVRRLSYSYCRRSSRNLDIQVISKVKEKVKICQFFYLLYKVTKLEFL